MLDTFIHEKVRLISFSQDERSNIAATLGYLKNIINYEPDFKEPFHGGSYKRGTMVKGVSDVDVYFRYVGTGNPQTALSKLKNCLVSTYPNSIIRQDKPSILADFSKIPINITPYIEDCRSNISIPDKFLMYWDYVTFGELENSITTLRQKNSKFVELIKILKLWNSNHQKGIKNYEIEKRVCNLFLSSYSSSNSISDWIWTFFTNNGYHNDANIFFTLMNNNYSEATLKSEWIKFIDNK